MIVDNNAMASGRYTVLPSGDYRSAFDAVNLTNKGKLRIDSSSTFTLTGFAWDASAPELRMEGTLISPTSLSLSSITLILGPQSAIPGLTSLELGYAGTVELDTATQVPLADLSALTIRNGGVLTHGSNYNTEQNKLNLTLASLEIDAGGKIDVTGKGYSAQQGPGAQVCGYAGGSYGGAAATNGNNCSGPTYGSYSAPVNLGSGGGNVPGGGAVLLNVAGSLRVDGSIAADGASNWSTGSGGSVYIQAGSLTGSGVISASGGACSDGGCGGGGRVAVITS
ncbi:MAG: hypothetical protein AAB578_08775, partial [Elusimicrobiota bacterium]